MAKFELLPEQIEDAAKMAAAEDLPNFSLAGTGKTRTALEAFRLAGLKRGLVIGPGISLKMWAAEIKDHLGASVQIVTSGSQALKAADFHVTTYGLTSGVLGRSLYKECDGGALILDEAHNLRSHNSKRAMNVYGEKMDGVRGLIERFDQVWPLTGNPIYRYADDLWGMLRALHPDLLHKYKSLTYEQFVNNFCYKRKVQYHPAMRPEYKVSGNTNEAVLRRILYEELGAIRRTVISGLPELTTRELVISLKAGNVGYVSQLRAMSVDAIVAALMSEDEQMLKVLQMLNLAKVKESAEYVIESAMNGPVLVGVWHKEVGEEALKLYQAADLRAVRVFGETATNERERIKDAFNAGELDVIVGQMGAMGTSWNLQGRCRHIVVIEDNFSPSVIEQFYKRVYRRGQKLHCQLDFIKADHPLDDAIQRVRERKQAGMDKILT